MTNGKAAGTKDLCFCGSFRPVVRHTLWLTTAGRILTRSHRTVYSRVGLWYKVVWCARTNPGGKRATTYSCSRGYGSVSLPLSAFLCPSALSCPLPFTSRTDRSDRSRSRSSRDPNQPLWDVVQDLFSTDPTLEACPGSAHITPDNMS